MCVISCLNYNIIVCQNMKICAQYHWILYWILSWIVTRFKIGAESSRFKLDFTGFPYLGSQSPILGVMTQRRYIQHFIV